MSLFKYFEKRAKDGLPDSNGPLSSHVPLEESFGQLKSGYLGAHGVSAESATSEGRKRGPYDR